MLSKIAALALLFLSQPVVALGASDVAGIDKAEIRVNRQRRPVHIPRLSEVDVLATMPALRGLDRVGVPLCGKGLGAADHAPRRRRRRLSGQRFIRGLEPFVRGVLDGVHARGGASPVKQVPALGLRHRGEAVDQLAGGFAGAERIEDDLPDHAPVLRVRQSQGIGGYVGERVVTSPIGDVDLQLVNGASFTV